MKNICNGLIKSISASLFVVIFLFPTLTAQAAVNKVYGTNGNDLLEGDSKYDMLFGKDGDDTLYGHDWRDILRGGKDNDTLYGGRGHDQLYGSHGDDLLYGENGQDFLVGGIGDDKLYGGSQVDWLDGGKGDDRLNGGSGFDTFVFGSNDGSDRLYGFKEGDRLAFKLEGTGSKISVHQSPAGALIVYGDTRIILMDVSYYQLHAMSDWLYWENNGETRSNNEV